MYREPIWQRCRVMKSGLPAPWGRTLMYDQGDGQRRHPDFIYETG